ncbi:MAG: HD domain-containing phosphohydrolase [Bacillota bacterium]
MSRRIFKISGGSFLGHRKSKAGLAEEIRKLRLIYEHVPAALVVLTPEFVITSASDFTKNFTLLEPPDLVGKRCYDVAGRGAVCPGCPVEKAIETGRYAWNIKKEPSPSGGFQYILQRAVPIFEKGKLVNVLEIIVDRTEQEMLKEQLEKDFLDTIEILVSLIELHDGYTGGHSHSVREISVRLAAELGLSEEAVRDIEVASVLHDIGKIGIKDSLLNKRGKLTDEEFEVIKRHPGDGEKAIKLIKRLSNPGIIIRHHHERYDGKGYPDGLRGSEIPLGSRILAVADSFDAMTSDRAYRKAMTVDQAVEELAKNKGTQFDPVVVDVFLKCYCSKGGPFPKDKIKGGG